MLRRTECKHPACTPFNRSDDRRRSITYFEVYRTCGVYPRVLRTADGKQDACAPFQQMFDNFQAVCYCLCQIEL